MKNKPSWRGLAVGDTVFKISFRPTACSWVPVRGISLSADSHTTGTNLGWASLCCHLKMVAVFFWDIIVEQQRRPSPWCFLFSLWLLKSHPSLDSPLPGGDMKEKHWKSGRIGPGKARFSWLQLRTWWSPGWSGILERLRCSWEAIFFLVIWLLFEVLEFSLTWGESFAENTIS